MAENDWLIGLTAGLDDSKSKEQIKKDIEKIKKDLTIALKVGKIELDEKQQNTIKAQLDKLVISLEDISVNKEALKGLVAQVNGALSGIKIAGLNITSGDIVNQVQTTGQQIEQQFNQGILPAVSKSENAINLFRNSLTNAGKSSSEIDSIIAKIKELDVRIDSLRFNESTKGILNIDVSGLDKLNNKVKITQSLVKDLENKNKWNVSNENTSVISTKEIEKMQNAFADYTQKIAQFKSTNANILSGLATPLSDFESKLEGLHNGTVAIDEVKKSFNMLNAEASKITSNLSGQLTEINPTPEQKQIINRTIGTCRYVIQPKIRHHFLISTFKHFPSAVT